MLGSLRYAISFNQHHKKNQKHLSNQPTSRRPLLKIASEFVSSRWLFIVNSIANEVLFHHVHIYNCQGISYSRTTFSSTSFTLFNLHNIVLSTSFTMSHFHTHTIDVKGVFLFSEIQRGFCKLMCLSILTNNEPIISSFSIMVCFN